MQDIENYQMSDPWVIFLSKLASSTSIEEAHAALLQDFAKSGGLSRVIGTKLSDLATIGDMIDTNPDGSIVLFKDSNFVVALSINYPTVGFVDGFQSDTIATPAASGVICFVSVCSEVEAHYYDLPTNIELAVFDEGIVLQDCKTKKVEVYDVLSFSPYRPFQILAKNQTYVSIALIERKNSQFQWVFDAKTGAALFQVTCSTESARIETLLDLLVRMAGDRIPQADAVAAFENLSRHELHFIRWKALQGLGELDGDLAMKRLKEMLSDPHPHVREMASEILQQDSEFEGIA